MMPSRVPMTLNGQRHNLFSRFKDLPKEVQLMIWETVLPLPEPRIIPVEPYNIGRSLTRIWNSRSSSIESPEAWQAFLNAPHIKDFQSRSRKENCETSLYTQANSSFGLSIHLAPPYKTSWIPTILFTSPQDTFYISKDILYDSPRLDERGFLLTGSGGVYESAWCWELNRVEKLDISVSTYGFEDEVDRFHGDWEEQVIPWFPNVKQVTFVSEYDLEIDTDAADLVLIDLTEAKLANESLPMNKKRNDNQRPPEENTSASILDFQEDIEQLIKDLSAEVDALEVHQDTLAKDLITVYQSKRYGVFSDDQDRIILRLNGIDLHPNTSVFDISGIFDGVDLHAFYWYPDAGWI
ncbi:uncharacterized protein PAC_05152 [Phialocephala subalpina]|uniref:2EXR domain-containing protein n=1 Tax=Phialocephala subalpina TaxID=576137 RepID=A0A1L7WR85_9HELO|nr:uncharacterized protein PAC_05152 [Phialocephala subalpina]